MAELFLSSIVVDPRSFAGRTALADVHQMHRSVMAAFPHSDAAAARDTFGVLYRVEADDRVLVQSRVAPDPGGLPAGFELAGARPLHLDRFPAGCRVRYRIVANTTRQEFVRGGRGRRVAVTGDDAVIWWEERAASAGLSLEGAPLVEGASALGVRRSGQRLTFCGHRFEGTATVADLERLVAAVKVGVGRAKAYGFGLLSVARIG